MNIRLFKSTAIVCIALISGGCASKSNPTQINEVPTKEVYLPSENVAKEQYPILKNNDPYQKAVVDMGKVLKTRITTYKDHRGILVASHDVFFWAVKPDFITTNTLPKRNKHQGDVSSSFLFPEHQEKINLDNRSIVDANITQVEHINDQLIDSFLKAETDEKNRK